MRHKSAKIHKKYYVTLLTYVVVIKYSLLKSKMAEIGSGSGPKPALYLYSSTSSMKSVSAASISRRSIKIVSIWQHFSQFLATFSLDITIKTTKYST